MIALSSALWFLPVCLPIAIWVAWSDMKFMKIPNKAVIAMAVAYAVVGLLAFPLQAWLWGWAVLGIVLLAGFVANAAGLVGAGDAKFAAAMAPVFSTGDLRLILALFAACLLGAFATHRLARLIPPVRRATADWESWTRKDFPMGLALAGTLIFYLFAPILAQ
ncbi:prepilin peptidase CpaA [Gemmobacter aquatilis]|uniref:Prepilin peptidase CpaA n=1 Tax=Gemmobacter aquatilis TaxID=933059 RepID=A0A1H8DFU9_9RHOB|nr:prepilin peptidase [Gemmobacter aquatilis]SEN06026.1 prepilin peptidase CpaA [Gemmobacter aquatilis]